MPPILITRNLAPAGRGGSNAQIMADGNGVNYYVKFKENGQALRILANEYVAGKIAEELKLPCPSAALIELDSLLVPTVPPINGISISQGLHFGTAQISNPYNLPGIRPLIAKCHNSSDFPLIVLFDAMLHNVDRNNDGNYIISTSAAGYKFNMIDHGHCFSANWNEPSLNALRGQWPNSYLPEMYSTITDRVQFDSGIAKIQGLSNTFFTTLVNTIPHDWLPLDSERQALIQFLIHQRDHIDTMLLTNKPKFPNWS